MITFQLAGQMIHMISQLSHKIKSQLGGKKLYFVDEERAKVEEAAHETLQQKIDRYNLCSNIWKLCANI